MIRSLECFDLDIAFEFAKKYQASTATQSYPFFTNDQDLENTLKHAYVLGYFDEDQSLRALGGFMVIEDRKTIQSVCGIYTDSKSKDGIPSIVQALKNSFPGYTLILGYPTSNVEAIDTLEEMGATLYDDCTVAVFHASRLPRLTSAQLQIERLNDVTEDKFRAYHDAVHPSIFWNSERILRNRRAWFAFMELERGNIVGSVTLKRRQRIHAEIITFDSSHTSAYEFLNRSLRYCVEKGIEDVRFYIDTTNAVALGAALANGFRVQEHYQLFTFIL